MATPYDRIRTALARAESADPPTALENLRIAADEVDRLLDEQLAAAVLDHDLSLRAAGAKAGLTENAVGPRLARTPMLAPYARPDHRVTAKDIQRARYDKEAGRTPAPVMSFKPRRNT